MRIQLCLYCCALRGSAVSLYSADARTDDDDEDDDARTDDEYG